MRPNPFSTAVPGFETLYVFGAGGFGREVAWLAQQAWGDAIEIVFLVNKPEYLSDPVNGIPVRLLSDVEPGESSRYVIGVGEPEIRKQLVSAFEEAGHRPAMLVHPRVEASAWVSLGEGTIVCAGNIITVNVTIGAHVHVNLDCTIGHDVTIGDFSTLSPGVHVSGNVEIGQGVMIGTGSAIINGKANAPLVIGDGAVVAAGACVTKPVEPGSMVAGVPAIRKR